MKVKRKKHEKSVQKNFCEFDYDVDSHKKSIDDYKRYIKDYKKRIKKIKLKIEKIQEKKEDYLKSTESYESRFDNFIKLYGERLEKIPNVFYSLRKWKKHIKYMKNEGYKNFSSYISEDEDGYVLSEKIFFNVDIENREIQLKVYDYIGKKIKRNSTDSTYGIISPLFDKLLYHLINGKPLTDVDEYYNILIIEFENNHSYIPFPEDYQDGEEYEFIIYKSEEDLGKVTLLSKKEQKKRFKYLTEGEKLGML